MSRDDFAKRIAGHLSTNLPNLQDGGIALSAFLKDTTSELAGLFSTLSDLFPNAMQGSC